MASHTKKRILVALDGSDSAFEAVEYVRDFPPFRHAGVTLFLVLNRIPENYWDFEGQPDMGRRIRDIRTWEIQNEINLNDYMEKARLTLVEAGFTEKGVKVNIHDRKVGIARDILKEARRGYEAVIVGRKGLSRLKDLVLGSVTTKLVERLSFAPLVVVGENFNPQKILLALDGSEPSEAAVSSISSFIKSSPSDMEIALIHVIRGGGETYVKMAQEIIQPAFEKARAILIGDGVSEGRITSKIVKGAASRAGSIIEEAKSGAYGTVVVGRRGLSRVQEFFMGRVSNKVVQLSRKGAVWVIG